MRHIFTSIFSLLIVLPALAGASPRVPLSKGMSMPEVLKAWGAPDEKIEKETRRLELWTYGEKSLVFHEGKLISVPDGEGDTLEQSLGGKHKAKRAHADVTERADNEIAMDEIFNEVLRSIPPDEGGKGGGASRPPPNMPPQMNRIIPGRPGGEMEDDLE